MLKEIREPGQIKSLSIREMQDLAAEIRGELVRTVSENGGHLASNLGVVELTIAMHYVYNCPEDRFVFDVGHQSYVHKLLTGRYEQFHTLRRKGGLSGFPDARESSCDCFVAGHASTAVSAALGMARAQKLTGKDGRVVALVGDGALTGGMCYEALNDAGQSQMPITVILNDNEMSISRNVGALSAYLSHLRQNRSYLAFKRGVRRWLEKIPKVGIPIFRFIEKLRDAIKSLFIGGQFFEALGFVYLGPIDGHDIAHLIRVLRRARNDDRPVLVHVVTQKGRGYKPAENHPDEFHGVAPFYIDSGRRRLRENEICYGKSAAQQLAKMADTDGRVCVITAAMPTGTGMEEFHGKHPERFFDVGIAEEHAITMAAGMADTGMKPYVAIYSTFLQRGYDQIMIDVCRCNLPVTFLVDHAGFVGADGRTHQGLFDMSYLRTIPNLVIAAPRDVRELRRMIDLSARLEGPMAIRYPHDGEDLGENLAAIGPLQPGEWELLSSGEDVMFFAAGPMVQFAMQASIKLAGRGIRAGVVDARFIKPMDEALLFAAAERTKLVVTLEENSVIGGLGEGIVRLLAERGAVVRTLVLGAPDAYVEHARISEQRESCGLSVDRICARIVDVLGEGSEA